MADIRSLLKNERAARRIQHKHASYSTTGTLLCTICHLQLKSESLWDGHLRSAGHLMRLQKHIESDQEPSPTISEPAPNGNGHSNGTGNKKKRKASDDEDEGRDTIRKRTKASNGLPEGFFDAGAEHPHSNIEMQIPSRPATPLKTPPIPQVANPAPPSPPAPKQDVDESEWAAFEADIASAEQQVQAANDAVISAPAITNAELEKKKKEEEYKERKERAEAEMEGDKEDAARKMEEELEEMQGLEERVRRMREKREELRRKESLIDLKSVKAPVTAQVVVEEEEDDEEEDDEWDGFRMKA